MQLLLIQTILLVIAIWKIKAVLKYRKSSQLFLSEIGGNWIDKTRVKTAIQFYIPLEISFFVMAAVLPVLFLTARRPFFWPIVITFLIVWFSCFFWWLVQFNARKD